MLAILYLKNKKKPYEVYDFFAMWLVVQFGRMIQLGGVCLEYAV